MPGKSVSEKLVIREGYDVFLVNPPKGYLAARRAECPKARFTDKEPAAVALIQLFVSSEAELKDQLPPLKRLLRPNVLLWVTYPKGTSKLRSDINRDTIREYAQTIGLQTVSLIAVDDVWSALRLKAV
jgi:hypothetical protein